MSLIEYSVPRPSMFAALEYVTVGTSAGVSTFLVSDFCATRSLILGALIWRTFPRSTTSNLVKPRLTSRPASMSSRVLAALSR